MAIYFELAMAPTSLHEGPTLRSTKAVAMPTCALHHDAGAPPCPSCETPHARTCAPWVGVETHEYDCVCPLCREAWLLSDTDAEELFGVAMRSGSEEWEPNWSEEVLARGATSQEILDEWRPECWFREDQQERARKPSVFACVSMPIDTIYPLPPTLLAPTLHFSLRPSSASPQPSLSQEEAHDEEHEEAREQARLDRTCRSRWLLPCAEHAHAACTLRALRPLHAHYTPTCRPA